MAARGLLRSPKLKCFVAMAFEREDTDAIYSQAIESCLRALSIQPVRIDKIEHNDDINNKILEGLESCDFAIADLTYARPSVYFEAGYAQREVPVIFTVRKDHFHPRSTDEFGNFRVHFDLQMRNIIGWKNSSDRSFQKRLARRVRYVTRPLLLDQRRSEDQVKEMTEFAALSARNQELGIRQILATAISSAGYKSPGKKSDEGNTGYRDPGEDSVAWRGFKAKRSNILFAVGLVPDHTTAKVLQHLLYRTALELPKEVMRARIPKAQLALPSSVMAKPKDLHLPKAIQDVFLCSNLAIPRSRISSVFPGFSYDLSERLMFGELPLFVYWSWSNIRIKIRLHVIDKVRALSALRTELKTRLKAIKS